MSPELHRYLVSHLKADLTSLTGFIQLGNEIPRYNRLKALLEEAEGLSINKHSFLKNRTEEVRLC